MASGVTFGGMHMTTLDPTAVGDHDGDIDTNTTANPHLNDLVAPRYSRR